MNVPDFDTVLADIASLDAEGRRRVVAAHRRRSSGADERTEALAAAASALIVAGHIRTWLAVQGDVRRAVDRFGCPSDVAEVVAFAQIEAWATEVAVAAAAVRLAGDRFDRRHRRALLDGWPRSLSALRHAA